MENTQQKSPFSLWIIIAALIVVADQATKWWIIQNYEWGQWTKITEFFNIVRAHNTGAAFSFLADAGGWQKWFFLIIGLLTLIFIVWQIKKYPTQKMYCASLTAIAGGAIGNIADRLMHGYVVDFLDFHWWGAAHFPAFNVADMAICLGAGALIVDELLRSKSGAV